MPFRLSSTSSLGMRLRSSSLSVVNRGQSLEYEQQAPQELQAPIGRHTWDLCGAILSRESPSLAERSRWTKSPPLPSRCGTQRAPACAALGSCYHGWRSCGLPFWRRRRSLLCFVLPLRPLQHPRVRVLSARRGSVNASLLAARQNLRLDGRPFLQAAQEFFFCHHVNGRVARLTVASKDGAILARRHGCGCPLRFIDLNLFLK